MKTIKLSVLRFHLSKALRCLQTTIAVLCISLLSNGVSAVEITPATSFSLENYHGKVVYLDFWASWCGPCRKSFPWMNELVERHGHDGFEVIAVTVDEQLSAAEKFLQKYPANFTVLSDPQGKMAEAYKIIGMPSSFLYDRAGKQRLAHKGFRIKDQNKLSAAIAAVVKEQPNVD